LEASSIINQPHPADAAAEQAVPFPIADEEDFFGADLDSGSPPEPSDQATEPSEPDVPFDEPQAAPEPSSEAQGEDVLIEAQQEALTETDKQRGAIDREYIVFRRTPLTATLLSSLLAELEDEAREPRLAYFELHRTVTRNDRDAVRQAYATHRHHLGSRCDLGVVSTRSFKIRHVEPRVFDEPRLKIT
jgi:hypothetical protein